jgi:hypothetical protein
MFLHILEWQVRHFSHATGRNLSIAFDRRSPAPVGQPQHCIKARNVKSFSSTRNELTEGEEMK